MSEEITFNTLRTATLFVFLINIWKLQQKKKSSLLISARSLIIKLCFSLSSKPFIELLLIYWHHKNSSQSIRSYLIIFQFFDHFMFSLWHLILKFVMRHAINLKIVSIQCGKSVKIDCHVLCYVHKMWWHPEQFYALTKLSHWKL